MAEIRAAEDKYVALVPRFELPKDFGKPPKPDIAQEKPAEAAPSVPEPTEQAPVTEGAEPEQAEPLTTGKDPEKPEEKVSPRRFERRIDRATKRAAEAEAKAAELERKIQSLESQRTVPADPTAPKMSDFTDIEEYAVAVKKHGIEQDRKERESKQQQEQTETAKSKLVRDWAERSAEAEDEHEDYAEKVGDLQPTTPWAIAIMESDIGPKVAYFLGTHLKEAQRIIALSPVSQIREIGKLEAKLSAQPEAPKKPSQAPKPISPVTGAAESGTSALGEPMPFEKYLSIGNKTFRGR